MGFRFLRNWLVRSSAAEAEALDLLRILNRKADRIMSAQNDFMTAEAEMLAALKADLAGRGQAIDAAVAKAQAAWEANDEAKWQQATQDMKDASAAIQAAGAQSPPFTPSGNVPAGG